MKLKDPRLKVIARDLEHKAMSPVISVAGLIKDGCSLAECAEALEKHPECIAKIYKAVQALIAADAAKRKPRKPKATDKQKMTMDWPLSEEDSAYAARLGFDATQIVDEADYFRRYWLAKGEARPGWSLTWQGWMRRKAERLDKDKARNAPPPPAQDEKIQISPEQWKSAIETYNDLGSWPQSYGPPPRSRGCMVPKEFLALVEA